MITLERARLVNWHYISDATIPLGNLTLFAGDNGSGKTTIIDAIQYALAADLRKARFNAATGDRQGGRDLAGYARCKLGTDRIDYLRGDTVSHIILSFDDGTVGFLAGVCIEAFRDDRTSEHFWIAPRSSSIAGPEAVAVTSAGGNPLSSRQLRDDLANRGAEFFDSKKAYVRELTARLGVFRRMAEYNPYLEAFTRSVSFRPLESVSRFVCDYILEDRPLDVSAMKTNLESYKAAEREAHATKARIAALDGIMRQGAEYESFQRNIRQQDYLKARIELDLARTRRDGEKRRAEDLASRLDSINDRLRATSETRRSLEAARNDTAVAIARDDAHQLFAKTKERLDAIDAKLTEATARTERYRTLRSQCAAILGRSDESDIEMEIKATDDEITECSGLLALSDAERKRVEERLRECLAELADLQAGISRYPSSTVRLRDELVSNGIDARVLADLAEVSREEWADAVEGWLNTLRFAVIVPPDDFRKALGVYDSLPRSVSGVALPDIARMRNAEVRAGSLAELVATESPYARAYLDTVLGDVMTADLDTLKNYSKAITRECMSYSRFTASRVDERVYGMHWLGRAAREKRAQALIDEGARLKREREELELAQNNASERLELLRRASRSLAEAAELRRSVAESDRLTVERAETERSLADIDTSTFRDLESRLAELSARIAETDATLAVLNAERGKTGSEAESARTAIERAEVAFRDREKELTEFVDNHAAFIAECEKYADERLRAASPSEIIVSFTASRKGIETKADVALRKWRELVGTYNNTFNAILPFEIDQSSEIKRTLDRYETSELPEYLEKIARKRMDAEREFKDHFIACLNERIEEAKESFREINGILRELTFGRDQYRFTITECPERRGQIEIIRKSAEITSMDDGLFAQLVDPADREAAIELFNGILRTDLDSAEMRRICDYRTYFTYDIRIKDTQSIDAEGRAQESSLSSVLRERSGGEAQTPYYVAIAASFYRFYKDRPDNTVRLVMFDEAFDRLDDERICKILEFYREIGVQLVISVPPEKIESIAPRMDRVNLVIRHGHSAKVVNFSADRETAREPVAGGDR